MIDIKKLFPEMNFEYSPQSQLKVINGELSELSDALASESRDRILEESLDVVQATCTLLYRMGYSSEDIFRGIERMQKKNKDRGYCRLYIEDESGGIIGR